MGGTISPMVKSNEPAAPAMGTGPSSDAQTSSSSSSASSSSQSGPSAMPPKSPWRNFQPSSPSPLSPSHHKVRSPRTHVAGRSRKAPKTPLSRLVLEKAVLHRDKSNAPATGGGGGVFGTESTRRANVVPDKDKGKGRDKPAVGTELKVSTTAKLAQSVGPGKRDLSASQGLGARNGAVKLGKIWR